MLGMMDSLSLSTQAALAGLERRLLAVEAKVDSYQPGQLPWGPQPESAAVC